MDSVTDVFLSYSGDDRSIAESLARRLEEHDWTVWWDRRIPAGVTFDRQIEEALMAARCVVVLWSPSSAQSRWVRAEAEEGARRHVLVPVLIGGKEIPIAFRQIQTADLRGWDGSTDHPSLEPLFSDIARAIEAGERLIPDTPFPDSAAEGEARSVSRSPISGSSESWGRAGWGRSIGPATRVSDATLR